MSLFSPLILVAVVVAIAYAIRASRADRPVAPALEHGPVAPAMPMAERGPAVPSAATWDLQADLARWVAADLLTDEQARSIYAFEHPAAPVVLTTPTKGARHGTPVVAEALGYLGGMLALIGLLLVVARYWPDMATVARLALSGVGALVFLGAGAAVREAAAPALARLRWFLWLASTAAAALFMGVLIVDGLGSDAVATVVFGCAGVVALESGLLWRRHDRPIQQVTMLGGIAAFAGAATALVATGTPVGVTVWLVGVAFLVIGVRRMWMEPIITEAAGAAAVVVGGFIAASAWAGFGFPFVLATAFALMTLANVPGLVATKTDQLVLGVIATVALLQAVPGTLGYFSQEAGGVTGVLTWAVGGVLVLVGARRWVQLASVAEVLGGVAILGGAALTATQWHGFAPIFGVVTAIGLVALGMFPGQVLLSVFGSVGLLINVPWAIAHFFPGEGRVPLLILVSGALILMIAVLISRSGGRLRQDTERLRHPRPPTGIDTGTS